MDGNLAAAHRHYGARAAVADAQGSAFAHLRDEARGALLNDPALVLWTPGRRGDMRAYELISDICDENLTLRLARVLGRAAMAGDADALALIDALATEHGENYCADAVEG